MHGQAVFKAVHPAGVLRHIAADGAGDLRGGIGAVIEPVGLRRLADRQVAHPRLQPCGARQGVDLENAVKLRQRQHHPFGMGHRPGTKPGACSPGHHGYLQAMADPEHLLHLVNGLRQHHYQRHLAIHRQAVALVGPLRLGIANHIVGIDKTAE